jgi:two-component system response regulator HydG
VEHAVAESAAEGVVPAEVTTADRKPRKPRYEAPADPDQEKRMIVEVLESEGGNKARAAKMLRMSRSTLYGKLDRFGIDVGWN